MAWVPRHGVAVYLVAALLVAPLAVAGDGPRERDAAAAAAGPDKWPQTPGERFTDDTVQRLQRTGNAVPYPLGPTDVPLCNLVHGDAGSGGDSSSTRPVAVGPDERVRGCLDRYDHLDWYTFSTSPGDAVHVELRTASCTQVALVLLDPDWVVQDVDEPTTCGPRSLDRFFHRAGEHHIALVPVRGEGTYELTVTPAPIASPSCHPQDDGGTGTDATHGHRPVLGPGTLTGCVDPYDDFDWFTRSLAQGEAATITLAPSACLDGTPDLDLFVFDERFSLVAASIRWDCALEEVDLFALRDTTYTVLVARFNGSGPYELSVGPSDRYEPTCHPQDDGGTGADSALPAPAPLSPGSTVPGCLDWDDAVDAYELDLQAGESVTVELVSPPCADGGADLNLYLYDPDLEPVARSTSPGCGLERATLHAYRTGTYHVVVTRLWGEAPYELSATPRWDLVPSCGIQDDAGSGTDASLGAPPQLANGANAGCLDGWATAAAGRFDGVDAYTLPVHRGEHVSLELAFPGACIDGDIYLVDAHGFLLAERRRPGCDGERIEHIAYEDTTWTVVVVASGGSAPYELTLDRLDLGLLYGG